MDIGYQIIKPGDKKSIELIADWYLTEWKIDIEKSIQHLSSFPAKGLPFQVMMTLNDNPIATGGIYQHVGLLDAEPKFKIWGPWLALVFTKREYRDRGYGVLLCEKIQDVSKSLDLKEIFLFTHTAESFYKRLGWQELERINLHGKDIVIMKKEL